MPRSATTVLMVCATLAVAGACAPTASTMDAEQFASARTVLQESPSMRTKAVDECSAKQALRPEGDRAMIGAVLKVDAQAAPAELCRRIVKAIVDGRLSHEDYVAVSSGSQDRKALARLVRAVSDS
ncbi:hypothetical protein [Geminicoccus flavidas]|uniref:hypothetical protein n=1 Tax=Geminicoccus flavidas TaxID=2506407 RepID=UPI00135AA12F|nr:hypothetical protein [Geminicoccus flavidas]